MRSLGSAGILAFVVVACTAGPDRASVQTYMLAQIDGLTAVPYRVQDPVPSGAPSGSTAADGSLTIDQAQVCMGNKELLQHCHWVAAGGRAWLAHPRSGPSELLWECISQFDSVSDGESVARNSISPFLAISSGPEMKISTIPGGVMWSLAPEAAGTGNPQVQFTYFGRGRYVVELGEEVPAGGNFSALPPLTSVAKEQYDRLPAD